MKNIFTKLNLLRAGLLLLPVVAILITLPRGGTQSFSYDIGQPWKYQLLTAEFDFPIYLDTAAKRRMLDSIDNSFVPFVIKDGNAENSSLSKFAKSMEGKLPPAKIAFISSRLKYAYDRGIVETLLYDSVVHGANRSLRTLQDGSEGLNSAKTIPVEELLTPRRAFQMVDSACNDADIYPEGEFKSRIVSAIDACIVPNVVPDTAVNNKFLSQEYFKIEAAQGVVKQGQRIVDIGEIVTPQIYTNLSTYESLLKERGESRESDRNYYVGLVVFILFVGGIFYTYLAINRPVYYNSPRMLTFLMTMITLLSAFTVILFENVSYGTYLVPICMLPITILVFTDSRTAVFALGCTVVLSALVAANPFRFIFMELSAGVVAAYSVHRLSRRSQIIVSAGLSFVVYLITYFICVLLQDGSISVFSWRIVLSLGINCAVLSFTYVLILVVEKLYGFTSDVTLVELSDINNPLLKRLAEEAPGTFQHSIEVSTLAADAARAVGANMQLVRTGAFYHDIGKIKSPIFFTENQHGVNPHAGLDPETSANKIISHVTQGVELAEKYKIPKAIINFIREHHGRGLTRYFYNTAVNERGEENVDKNDFRYPGPDPHSLETTLVMMADSVEAASRSLKNYDEKSIGDLVDRIIDTQISEGLYSDSPISFRDVEIVKKVFKNRLATIYHSRVAYPSIAKKS